jgi:hypothetical protein
MNAKRNCPPLIWSVRRHYTIQYDYDIFTDWWRASRLGHIDFVQCLMAIRFSTSG